MKNFKVWNIALGWVAFVVAAITYLMTIEPTASFWDCGEFITSAYKLEVGHPPGNPVFMILGQFFTNFASGPGQVAVMVNAMSALLSAATILLLFWSISMLAKKIIVKDDEQMTLSQGIMILGSAMVGALVYTFSDTFWFSAVEGEVYAFSSLLTALVFWLILKWEERADDPYSDRWIVLIAYIMGLSIGVHLLNLLCIPAIVLVYYFKKRPNATLKGAGLALLGSFVLVGVLMYGIIPGVVKLAGVFELFFVNTIGLSFNSGLIVYLIALVGSLAWGIYETMVQTNSRRMNISILLSVGLMGIPFYGTGWTSFLIGLIVLAGLGFYLFKYSTLSAKTLNTVVVSMMVIFMGYSSFALIMIRSAANPPMDQNSPEDIFSLERYLNREQYGDRPLFYGETFVSEVERTSDGAPRATDNGPVYGRKVKTSKDEKDSYVAVDRRLKYEYEKSTSMLFPRMYSRQGSHVGAYKEWSDFKGSAVRVSRGSETQTVYMPTFFENIKFFVSYQLNFMYWRYFMWNFTGRQNDVQGNGEVMNGNWMSGIPFIDQFIVGDQTNLPDVLRENKGRNVYYFLPLILGILGLLFQAYRGEKGIQSFWVTFFLFFMTGIAIVIYLNQTPYQPRERDYAFAGSFYAFAIWVGLGVASLSHFMSKYINKTLAASLATLFGLAVSAQMAAQNWDDHDRSNRYTCRDFGFNYLTTCEPNAIIFTNGDNDTFPLWYSQEVEGYRTDVRVCNLSYLQTDWYIDQMRRTAYDSKPLPISFTPNEYKQGTRDIVYVMKMINTMPLETAMEMVKSNDPQLKTIPGYSGQLDYIPSDLLTLSVDRAAAQKAGVINPVYQDSVGNTMQIRLTGKQYLGKHEMIILDMLNNNRNWNRPIYYAVTVGNDQYLNLQDYFSLEGLAYRITPMKVAGGGSTNTEKMFDNMVNKFKWGGVETGKVYLDENNLRMCKTFRYMFGRLVTGLISEGKNDKALQALDRCVEVLPSSIVPNDYSSLVLGQSYFEIDQPEKAQQILEEIAQTSTQFLAWFVSLTPIQFNSINSEMGHHLAVLQNIVEIYSVNGKEELAKKHYETLSNYGQYFKR